MTERIEETEGTRRRRQWIDAGSMILVLGALAYCGRGELFLSAKHYDAPRQLVDSEAIRSVGYAEDRSLLAIQFVDSTDVYFYQRVPASLYAGLLAAPSKGAYFHKHIRDQYEFFTMPE